MSLQKFFEKGDVGSTECHVAQVLPEQRFVDFVYAVQGIRLSVRGCTFFRPQIFIYPSFNAQL